MSPIRSREERHRKVVLPLAVATVLLTLGLFIGASYFISVYAVRKATANSLSITQFCQSTNAARARQRHLWHFILSFNTSGPPQGVTKAQYQKEIDTFTDFIDNTYKPRDCNAFPFNPNK